jgi:hypothetical protein
MALRTSPVRKGCVVDEELELEARGPWKAETAPRKRWGSRKGSSGISCGVYEMLNRDEKEGTYVAKAKSVQLDTDIRNLTKKGAYYHRIRYSLRWLHG